MSRQVVVLVVMAGNYRSGYSEVSIPKYQGAQCNAQCILTVHQHSDGASAS